MRIESYGTVDELNSLIGLVRDQIKGEEERNALLEIQSRLFTIGSILATDSEKMKDKIPDLHESDVDFLESEIDRMDGHLKPLQTFILPGGHPAVSTCHIARCVCRRAERYVVRLNEVENIDPIVIKYLNRLSDYLFTLARKIGEDFGANEIPWIPRS